MAKIVGPTDVYKAFDDDGEILYVGISYDASERLRQHRRSSRWWGMATWFEVDRYATREEAENVEAASVMFDDPPFNIDPCGPAGRRVWADIAAGVLNYPTLETHEFHASDLGWFRHG